MLYANAFAKGGEFGKIALFAAKLRVYGKTHQLVAFAAVAAQLCQRPQQRGGIFSARKAHADAVAVGKQAVELVRFADFAVKVSHCVFPRFCGV